MSGLVILSVLKIRVVGTIFETHKDDAYKVVKLERPIPGGPASKMRNGFVF